MNFLSYLIHLCACCILLRSWTNRCRSGCSFRHGPYGTSVNFLSAPGTCIGIRNNCLYLEIGVTQSPIGFKVLVEPDRYQESFKVLRLGYDTQVTLTFYHNHQVTARSSVDQPCSSSAPANCLWTLLTSTLPSKSSRNWFALRMDLQDNPKFHQSIDSICLRKRQYSTCFYVNT